MFWANVVITALRDERGTLRGFSKVTRDLTERKQAEDALREARDDLERRVAERTADLAASNAALRDSDRQKDQFMAVLAHELRNPLAPIRNGLQVLRYRHDETTVEQVRQLLGRQVGHLARLVEDLLEAARVKAGKTVLRRELLDLARLARYTVSDEAPAFDAAGLVLAVEAPETPVWVSADWTRLSQVVGNLLQNALKFTDRGGRVSVAVRTDGSSAELSVRDTGVGIRSELLPCLFIPFMQADQGLARSRGGLGLGLALVKGLAELHGGTVAAESGGEGLGATFTVRLPLAREPAAVTGGRPVQVRNPGRSLRVLIVEDNEDSAESLRMALELAGCEVVVAHTGPGGVDAAKARRPDLVLCDIGLPGFSGYEVARRIRAEADGAVVLVALTGYGREQDQEDARAAGFNRHFTKPVDFGQLELVLSEVGSGPLA
jgi:signal transduction histidine kinase/CheY-like chemotaxis protein